VKFLEIRLLGMEVNCNIYIFVMNCVSRIDIIWWANWCPDAKWMKYTVDVQVKLHFWIVCKIGKIRKTEETLPDFQENLKVRVSLVNQVLVSYFEKNYFKIPNKQVVSKMRFTSGVTCNDYNWIGRLNDSNDVVIDDDWNINSLIRDLYWFVKLIVIE
jgi:hypothetical protein